MRYIVYGAGAVGGVIGGRLFQHGHDVTLIARGAHFDALKSKGLELQWPEGEAVLPIQVVRDPRDLDHRRDDVVILAMKTQDTPAALDALADAVSPGTPIVCAQNGVENERLALRRFANVYGMCVMLPATHLEPGVVQANGAPLSGILDIGRVPSGSDDCAADLAGALDASMFSARADEAIMRRKYAKLLTNLGNAVEAACGADGRSSDVYQRLYDEGVAVLRAAGIDVASQEEDAERRGELVRLRPVGGKRRDGGSTWQSLARGATRIEADWLNGEIVLLGRRHGVPTPVNAAVQWVANRLAREGAAPGSLPVAELEAELARWS